MSRATDDAPVTSRTVRERLAPRHEPYWRTIEGGVALGYRKGARGGVWIARMWEAGAYHKTTLGKADDVLRATLDRQETVSAGEVAKVLDFRQAQAKAQEWAAQRHRVAMGLEPARATAPAKPVTVANVVAVYLDDYAARGGKALSTTQKAVNAHILPALGDIAVGRLTREKIKQWHRALSNAPARLRAKAGEQRFRTDDGDPDVQRRRRASANRVLTILKAALNHARQDGKITCSDDAWALVKPFQETDKARVRYLLEDETTRFMNACSGDFRNLVTAALLTGCRYGELAAMVAGDFDPVAGTITVGRSKANQSRHVFLTTEGGKFFEHMIVGKVGSSLIFERDGTFKQATLDGAAVTRRVQWGKSDQFRFTREACAAAKIAPVISFHVLRHTYGSRLAMRGVAMGVIAAQMGHKDTRMTEKHYAHLAPSYVANTFRQNFGELGIVEATNVTPIRAQRARPLAG